MTRRGGRRHGSRVGLCPGGCGVDIVWALYIPEPERMDPAQPRKRVPLDMPPIDPTNGLLMASASHAASPGRTVCRRLTPDRPLEPGETAHLTHFATHPECRPWLTPNPTSTTKSGARTR